MNTPRSVNDEELALQSQAGSSSAFEQLVLRHEARLYRYICHRCRHVEDARDITQTAFVTAFQKLAQFDPRYSFASWLFAIARRKSIDHGRSQRWQEPSEPEIVADPANPASDLEEREEADSLWALARRTLSADQFETLWLRYQEDLSVREVARATQHTETRVKVTLFRARQKLAVLLRQERRDPGLPKDLERSPTIPASQPQRTNLSGSTRLFDPQTQIAGSQGKSL